MLKENIKNSPVEEKEKEAEAKKPEGSNWSTSTPPGYREEM